MKTVEIYFRDLKPEAQQNLLNEFCTHEDEENWEIEPLAIVIREESDEIPAVDQNIDRVKDWKTFSEHMEQYIKNSTVDKYTLKDTGFDLITFTEPSFLVWNILKYCIRILNGHSKEHDLEKIVHYAEIWWIRKSKS
jgi:hypothetical protein